MYELPTQGNIKRVVLDEAAITGEGKPLLVYADENEPKPEVKKPAVRDAAA
jgi:ATP-dependent Clp protease ATP-binding subunit ClpX